MISYHGTSDSFISTILIKIDISLGGGELGMGFYSGEYLHVAKAWAYNKHNKSKSVLKLETPDDSVEALNIYLLDHTSANNLRSNLRKTNQCRTFTSGHDLIWAPIVGTTKSSSEQYKWESTDSEKLLNSNLVIKNVV